MSQRKYWDSTRTRGVLKKASESILVSTPDLKIHNWISTNYVEDEQAQNFVKNYQHSFVNQAGRENGQDAEGDELQGYFCRADSSGGRRRTGARHLSEEK